MKQIEEKNPIASNTYSLFGSDLHDRYATDTISTGNGVDQRWTSSPSR